jgi:hypothetical protein
MFITKKHIDRRTLLKGAGVALGLPLLESMFPAATALAQAAAAPPRRFFAGFVPHGAAPGYWVPEKAGALPGKLPFIWEPLEPVRKSVTILTGLHATSSEPPPGETGADHWVAAAFLCADKPKKTAGADVRAGHTIDQIIAEKIGRETLLPSVEMSVEDPGSGSSNCGEGYSCVYTNTIAWASPTTPLPMELNPQVVFERLFGSGSTPEHFDVPPGIPQSFDEHIKLMFDLLALGFQADLTRVGTLLFARDLTGRRYPESAAPNAGFHGVSHHGEDPALIKELSKINQYHVKMLAYFADKLAKIEEADGTLLDHSLLLFGSNMGNPNQHLHYDVPHVLIGGNHGAMKGERHLAYPSKTVSTGNLLLSLLDQFDIHRDTIGDSTGRLTDL